MASALKQSWWAPVAALVVVGAGVLAMGLWKRPGARVLGDVLIVIGALFAAIWFWSLTMPLLAVIVVVGLAVSEVRAPGRTVGTP